MSALPPTASVEPIRVNRLGYTARGRYFGRDAMRLYRLTDSGLDAHGGIATGIDTYYRARNRREATAVLARAIAVANERFTHYQTRAERSREQTACDFEDMCMRYARRDALNAIGEE